MNIEFTIKANTFRKAADIEDFLKTNSINYTSNVDDKPSLGAGKRGGRRHHTTRAELAAVTNELNRNPDRSWVEIAKACGVHDQTVSKIARKVHPLQRKANSDKDVLRAAVNKL